MFFWGRLSIHRVLSMVPDAHPDGGRSKPSAGSIA